MMSETELRTQKAVSLFEQGYNCAQSVFMAYADIFGVERELAAKLPTSFGGGMGRLREVCGALSGAFMLLGLKYPFTDVHNKALKNENYKKVQAVAGAFKQEMGSYICADLLHIRREAQHYVSADRTKAYYAERPCSKCVRVAAEIVGKEIFSVSE